MFVCELCEKVEFEPFFSVNGHKICRQCIADLVQEAIDEKIDVDRDYCKACPFGTEDGYCTKGMTLTECEE